MNWTRGFIWAKKQVKKVTMKSHEKISHFGIYGGLYKVTQQILNNISKKI